MNGLDVLGIASTIGTVTVLASFVFIVYLSIKKQTVSAVVATWGLILGGTISVFVFSLFWVIGIFVNGVFAVAAFIAAPITISLSVFFGYRIGKRLKVPGKTQNRMILGTILVIVLIVVGYLSVYLSLSGRSNDVRDRQESYNKLDTQLELSPLSVTYTSGARFNITTSFSGDFSRSYKVLLVVKPDSGRNILLEESKVQNQGDTNIEFVVDYDDIASSYIREQLTLGNGDVLVDAELSITVSIVPIAKANESQKYLDDFIADYESASVRVNFLVNPDGSYEIRQY